MNDLEIMLEQEIKAIVKYNRKLEKGTQELVSQLDEELKHISEQRTFSKI